MKQRPPNSDEKRKKTTLLSRDDAELWHRVQKTVEPLAGKSPDFSELQALANSLPDSVTSKEIAPKQKTVRQFPVSPYMPPVSTKTASTPHEIDDKTAKKLLKGRVSIDDRIDLHGMTQDQAHRLLGTFLMRCHNQGKRMVLVITGKGRTTGGILRQMVPQWLKEPAMSVHVSAFRQAHVTHGGDGALYVRLRKLERR